MPRQRKPPQLPLDPGEFAEVVLRGALRSPDGVGRFAALVERFFGLRLGARRWVVLTNRRLVLLRRRDPGKYSAGQWFDVSLDRAGLRASMPFLEGNLVVLALVSRKGAFSLLLPERSLAEARRLARVLG